MKKIDDYDKVIKELSDLRYKRGWSRSSLVEYLKSQYDLKDSRAYELVRDMLSITAKLHNKLNEDALADSLQFMEEMKQKAVGEGETKLALEWSKEIHKVSQLYVQKLDITSKGEKITININKKDDN